MRAVAPAPPHQLTYLKIIIDSFAERVDLADLGVAPYIDGIVESGLPWQKKRRLGIPLLLQIGIRTSIHRQLCPGRDAGVERTDPNLTRTGLRGRIRPYSDDPGGFQLDDVRHEAALSAMAVVRRASSAMRELSK